MSALADDIPEHIEPRSLTDFNSDELEALLTRVRAARLRGAQIHAEAMAAAKMARDDKAREQLETQCGMLQAGIERVDKAVEAMDARINKIRALRLELGLD
jgi:hypothetical protein